MKKTSTRILSAILAVVMLVGLVPMAMSSSAAFNDTSLKFDEKGNFTVVQITDIQENTEVHETTLALIAKAMNKYEPDMVVMTGDNVESGMDESEFKTAVSQFMAPIIAANVRYAVTFGNHDDEDRSIVNTAWDKESQYNYYVGMSPLAIDYDEDSLSGVGTGSIPIYSNDGSRVAFCIFPIDSGTYDSNDDYDHVKTDQINWYASESARLAQLNNGNPVPTLTFQHIPVPEIYSNLLVEVPQGTAGSVQGTGNWQNNYYILDPNNPTITGVMEEGPCPAAINNGQYQGWRDVGNHVGAFFGHDHTNTFMGTDANGITMGYCKAATLEAYHAADEDPAIRVFNIKEDGTYTTQSVSYAQMQTEESEDYERDEISGTPTVPEVIYVGAADNSIAKQEFGSAIQLTSLNHKTQSMYSNDLTVTIDLDKNATNVTITPTAGINLSGVTVTSKDDLSNTYTWTITGGTATAGSPAEFKVEYDFAGKHYAQYAYSYVDNIKSPAGHYVFIRNYGGVLASNEDYWNTQTYVMTILGKTVYGNARVTSDNSYGDLEAWTNTPAGYYDYTKSEDAGFVQKDTTYGMNFCSPARIKNADTFPRYTEAGRSPVATIYADLAEVSTITDLGVAVNYWRHYTPEHDLTITFQTAIKQGDVGYTPGEWNANTVGTSTISVQNASAVLTAARGTNLSNPIIGSSIPENGTTYTLLSRGYSRRDTALYDTNVYSYMPVLLKFVTYDKTELRELLNAERTENRQFEKEEDTKTATYRNAFKEAFKQIQKVNTTQTDINNAKSRLEKAIENLNFTGADISNNSEYYMNASVPSKLYVAGSGYGTSQQPKGTTVVPQIINYRTRAMIDYSNFRVTLPNGATNALVEVINQNTGAAMTYTWDAATASGKVTGGTANVGDTITYKFTYELGGKSYTQIEASTVTDAPQASGWLTFIRRTRQYAWEAHTSQQTVLYFAPEGVVADGIQYEALQGNGGYDNTYYGVNLTNFNGEGSQKVGGFGINSWTGPGRQNQGGWYCGTNGDNDTRDEGYRAKFNLFFDSSVATDITDAKIMFVAQGLGCASDESQGIEQRYETYYQGQGNHSSYGTDLGNLNSAAINGDGSTRGNSTLSNTVGDAFYKYLTVSGLATGGYTYYSYFWNKTNDGSRALTCHYAWHLNIKTVDKTDLRNLIAQENQEFRQFADGYSDANGKWTAYVNALAKAKGAAQDASLTGEENEAYATALQNAINELEYVPADYTELRALVDSIRRDYQVDPETGVMKYQYRPHPDVDPLYYAREEFYPWNYFRSTNETDIPINNINWNLDIRYQAEVDTYVELVEIGWASAQLRDADYTQVDALLEYKSGTNPNGSYGGLTIELPEIEKYAMFEDLENRNISFEDYTTESYNAWANACAPAMTNRSLKMADQPIVDGYRDALQTAYNNLELKGADYTQLNQTIDYATSNIDSTVPVIDPSNAENTYEITYYQADFIAQLRAKIAEKKEGLYILQQEEVDVLNYEIDQIYIQLGNHLNEADFTFAKQQQAIRADYEAEHEKYYTADSWNRLLAARAAVTEAENYGYMAGEQASVNAAAQEVYDARTQLVYNPANFDAVNIALKKVKDIESTKNDYENWDDLQAAVDAVDTSLDIRYQDEVDAMAEAIEAAYAALKLKDADYTKLNTQITAGQAAIAQQQLYQPGTYLNFLEVYNVAHAFYMADPKVDIQHQYQVDEQEAALKAAIEQLEFLPADMTPIEEAQGTYFGVDTFSYEMEYTTDTDEDGIVDVLEELYAAYDATVALQEKDNKGEINNNNNAEVKEAADALNAAIANLPALYASVDYAMEEIPAEYYTTPEMFTPASKKALDDAIAAVNRNLKIGDQETVENYANAIYDAIAALEEADANLAALNEAKAAADAKIKGVDTNNFTDDSWAAFEAAYEAAAAYLTADPAPKYSEQADIDAAAQALVNATAGLAKKGAYYGDLDAAIAAAKDLNKADFTAATWANLESALANAEGVDKTLTVDDQATIDNLTNALNAAITALKRYADYSALDKAIEDAEKLNKDDYTSATWNALQDAVEAAKNVDRTLSEDDQATVDNLTTAIGGAISVLKGYASYAALDEKIAEAKALNKDDWTPETWANLETALANAEAVDRTLSEDDQTTVNNLTTALDNAIKALESAEVPLSLNIKEGSTTIIDEQRGFIYGLGNYQGVNALADDMELTDLIAQGYLEIEGDGRLEYEYVGSNTTLGTGAKVKFINNKTNEVVATYYIVVFGDCDGDGFLTYGDYVDFYAYLGWADDTLDYGDFTNPAVFALDLVADGEITLVDLVECYEYIGWASDEVNQVRNVFNG